MAKFQKAFILLRVAPGHEKKVLDDLMKVSEVKEAHIVPGEWDILAVVESQKEIIVPSDERIYRIILDKVSKIKYIKDTQTLVSQFSKTK
ncbi:MAG: Lrp/AsnC ligand binding domain-containing protein [Thaumarchaeota archaeon]|nr:Lrp/AsnC ligand binding domain-containing protein [Nitrososphaerota archaeon]